MIILAMLSTLLAGAITGNIRAIASITVPIITDHRQSGSEIVALKDSRDATSAMADQRTVLNLTIRSEILGSAYTHAKSTLKDDLSVDVTYDAGSKVFLTLDLPDAEDPGINSDYATVTLLDGDGYFASEYILKANKLLGSWETGSISYSLEQGDLIINTGDYLISDTNSGREWTCLGGDGQGNYTFILEVAGITYNGQPVATQTFRSSVFIYGFNHTSDANTTYGAGIVIKPVIEPLDQKVANPPKRGDTPVYTWIGVGDKPNLADTEADDIYITWPNGTDASELTANDIKIVLHSTRGDMLDLSPDDDYVIDTSSGETQIAITLHNWAYEPVYNTMSVVVDGSSLKGTKLSASQLSKTYDIGSVYVYATQQGGGGTTIDGTVTAFSFYGLLNFTQLDQLVTPTTYTLSTDVNGTLGYYAESTNGTGFLVDTITAAKSYDGSGGSDCNVQLIGNTVYVTTRINATATKLVGSSFLTFTKEYAVGMALSPAEADPELEALPGYILDRNISSWAPHEKWAWQRSVAVGWTGIDIQPYTGKFEWTVAKGASQQFTANASSVNWTLIGNSSKNTTISTNGNLVVALDETSNAIAVVATSTTDQTVNNKGTINVNID